MTDAECAEILAEYRKLTLGPELSAAMDHAIAKLRRDVAFSGPLIERAYAGFEAAELTPGIRVGVGGFLTTTATQ